MEQEGEAQRPTEGGEASPEESGEPLLDPGLLAGALLDWPGWCHRKVESLQLLEGERARRRVSVDCTPPRQLIVGDRALVPLTWIAKGPMRSFDMIDGAGNAVPVLGAAENGELCRSLIALILNVYRGQEAPTTADADIDAIVFGQPEAAEAARARLFKDVELDSLAEYLVAAVCSNFLLIAVLDRSAAGTRQVLKYSYHWEMGPKPAHRLRKPVTWVKSVWASALAGLGLTDAAVDVAIGSADSAASFHLEVPSPPGLLSTSLELVGGDGGSPRDDRLTAVAHAHARFDGSVEPSARVTFMLSPNGTHRTVTLAAWSTAALFWLALLLPGALEALRRAADGTSSLLLFGPALLVATLARTGENVITSRLYAPLRALALSLAGLLFVAGASLVGQLNDPWLVRLWSASAVLSVAAAIVLSVARGRMSLRMRGIR